MVYRDDLLSQKHNTHYNIAHEKKNFPDPDIEFKPLLFLSTPRPFCDFKKIFGKIIEEYEE